jgi:POT family proton-dependent oligopeptide transporter
MVGNMVGTSLAMAPGFVLGQLCDIVDLDGPTFLRNRSPARRRLRTRQWCRRRPKVWGADAMIAKRGAMSAAATWFGQPRGLTVLFLTNMWEQFSYYGMRALLVYYMTKQLLLGQAQASVVYGAYTACAYFTPIIGGIMADRLLGKRRAVIIGASVMAAGHFMMAFEPLFYRRSPRSRWATACSCRACRARSAICMARRSAARLGVQRLLRRHQHRRLPGAAAVRHDRRGLWLALRLRPGRHRHAGRVGDLPGRAAPSAAGAAAPVRHQASRNSPPGGIDRQTVLALAAVGVAVTVFRGAYEQVGNTVALWADTGCRSRRLAAS